MRKDSPTYPDQQIAMRANLNTSRQEVVAYFAKAMGHYSEDMLVIPFNTGNHWVTQSISTKHDQVWYCDSSRLTDPVTSESLTHDWTDVITIPIKFLLHFIFWSFPHCMIILHWHTFLFRAFDMYVVKVLGLHPKDKYRQLKHYTKFCIQQQTPSNTCVFHVCLNIVAFGAQPNCGISVSAFILLYCWCLWLNMHIHLLLIHTSHFIMEGQRKGFHWRNRF
jgi:hypothetical protein